MARSHRTIKTGHTIIVDGVKFTVLGGRATIQIHSRDKPEHKVKTKKNLDKQQ